MLATISHSMTMPNQTVPILTALSSPSKGLPSQDFLGTRHLFQQAAKIKAYQSQNFHQYISSILNNMGFEKSRTSSLKKLIYALKSGKIDIHSIDKTSGLSRILREFECRERAFDLITKHGEEVADNVLRDVAYPIKIESRKEAEQQALHSLKTKPTEHVPTPRVAKSTGSLLHGMINRISQAASRISSALDYINTQVLNFPGASAQKTDLLLENFNEEQQKEIKELIKSVSKIVKEEVQKVRGKRAILLLGPTGAGKGTFGNYISSDWCESNHGGVNCSHKIFNTSSDPISDTRYLKVVGVTKHLTESLGQNTVLVDMPGYFDKRKERLVSLVYSLFTSKSIKAVRKETHINVYLIDYNTIKSEKGKRIADIRKSVEQEGEANPIILVTKVLNKFAFEVTNDPVIVVPSKEGITQVFQLEQYSESSLKHLILYDVADRDLANKCVLNNGMYKCTGGGGSNRVQITEKLKKIFALAKKPANNVESPHLEDNNEIKDLEKELIQALNESFNSSPFDFEKFNEKYQKFEILLKINSPALEEIKNEIVKSIGRKMDTIFTEIDLLQIRITNNNNINKNILTEIMDKIQSLSGFDRLRISSEIDPKIQNFLRKTVDEFSKKIFNILETPSIWKDHKTRAQAKLLFDVIQNIDSMQKTNIFEHNISVKLDDQVKSIEDKYYENLRSCSFDRAKNNGVEFKHLQSFLAEVAPGYSYIRDRLAPYTELESRLNYLVRWQTQKDLLGFVGSAMLFTGSLCLSGPALAAASGVQGLVGLPYLKAVLEAAWAARNGVWVSTGAITGFLSGLSFSADAAINLFTQKLCHQAWQETGFEANVPVTSKYF